MKMKSCYSKYWDGKEPLFTNYTERFIGCLDYILYNEGDGNLSIEGTGPLMDISYVKNIVTLPSNTIPSDHLPLQVDFSFSPSHSSNQEGAKMRTQTRSGFSSAYFRLIFELCAC